MKSAKCPLEEIYEPNMLFPPLFKHLSFLRGDTYKLNNTFAQVSWSKIFVPGAAQIQSKFRLLDEHVRFKDMESVSILNPKGSALVSVFKNSYQTDQSLVHTQA